MKKQFLFLSVVFVICDQILKLYFVRVGSYVLNEGIAFGLFQNNSAALILSLFTLLVIIGFSYKAGNKNSIEYVAITFIVMGGVSNLIDRVVYAGVVDYIQVGMIPVFNLADVMVNTGMILIIVSFIKDERSIQTKK